MNFSPGNSCPPFQQFRGLQDGRPDRGKSPGITEEAERKFLGKSHIVPVPQV
jgi:hypothetical protein